MAKAPAFQFYPGDWLRDAKLRACSLPARGLWIDMVCIMHQGEPYGHLTLTGAPVDATMLARMVGTTPRDATAKLAELENAGVFSRTEAGIIYSRRMVNDEQVRRARAAGGALGGNPALKDNHKDNCKVNLHANLKPTPSSSSPSSSPSSPSTALDDDDDGAKDSCLKDKANQIARHINISSPDDRSLIAKVAVLWDEGELSDDDIQQVLESFSQVATPVRNRAGWFYRCVSNKCSEHGKSFEALLARTSIPIALAIPATNGAR